MAILDDYFEPYQLGGEIKKSERTLARWRTERKGPPVTRFGGKPFYRKESVKQWMLSLELKQRVTE